jgi:DNA gyrase subunit B
VGGLSNHDATLRLKASMYYTYMPKKVNPPGANAYDANSLTVLKGLDAVRKRPGMYIGSTDSRGLTHLIWEILDNAVDEATAGFCTKIDVIVHEDSSIEIVDNGRGVPVDTEKTTGKSGLELVFTELHAGAKFGGGSYGASGGLHGVGASVVNALSQQLVAEVVRDGCTHRIEFTNGVPSVVNSDGTHLLITPVSKEYSDTHSGTSVRWWPDTKIFDPGSSVDYNEVRARLRQVCFLIPKLTVWFHHNGSKEEFYSSDGLADFCEFLSHGEPVTEVIRLKGEGSYVETVPMLSSTGDMIATPTERTMEVDIAIRWVNSWDTVMHSFVNVVSTPKGGSHVAGFERALTRSCNEALREFRVLKDRDESVTKEDVQEGMVVVIKTTIVEPQFEGQTKDILGTPAASQIVSQVVLDSFREFLTRRAKKADGRSLLQKIANASKARQAARAQREHIRRKNAMESSSLPAKLADCRTHDLEQSELLIIEGDSAGGSAKAARDSEFQALLPLRGKILNVAKSTPKQVLENNEVCALISALGAGSGKTFDTTQLRYGRLILMTDADVDGAHIRTLVLTLIYHYMRPLLEENRVFAAMPPLYLLKVAGSKEQFYAYTDAERDTILSNLSKEGKTVRETQRYKGLGEMDAEQLAVTTMDPTSRSLRLISIKDADAAAQMFDICMGSEVEPRKKFIVENANLFDKNRLDV